jgi:uncharacterized oxidoreductase
MPSSSRGATREGSSEAQGKLSDVQVFPSDVSYPKAIPLLFERVLNQFPALNVLINNAGIMRKINLASFGNGAGNRLEVISREIETDLVGPVRMVAQFLPHRKTQATAAIVNVSSGLAFVPLPIAPIYCAAKAGMHSFTQSLRVQLQNTRIRVFELAPPITRTPLFTGEMRAEDVKGIPMMDVGTMVGGAIQGINKDQLEIRPGLCNMLKLMSRVAPQFILNRLSKQAKTMLAQATAHEEVTR